MRSVILTGAAGGIGMATLPLLVDAGYIVYAGAMDPWEMGQLEAEKARLKTENIIPVMLDLRVEEHIESVLAQVEADHPDLAGVIANGAACPFGGPFELVDLNSTRDVYETNVIGNLRLLRRSLDLLKQTRGRIVMVSSMWGLIPGAFALSYTASKHACEAFCGVMRRELSEFGIKLVTVNPGGVKETYMVAHHYDLSRRYLAKLKGVSPEEVCSTELDTGGNTKLMQPDPQANEYYRGHYQTYMDFTREVYLPESMKFVATPADCARDVMRGLQHPNPKVRYRTGWDCKIASFLNWLLPERWMDKLVMKGFAPRVEA